MSATIFFCDISDTINGSIVNTAEDYQKFAELIMNIKKKNKSDYIIFSLVSSDNEATIKNVTNILKLYNSYPITFGKQFFDKGYINNEQISFGISGKCNQIIYYLNELSKSYIIDDIILADDCEISHYMLQEIAKSYSWSDRITTLIPTKRVGLSELNQLIEQHIDNFKKKELTI